MRPPRLRLGWIMAAALAMSVLVLGCDSNVPVDCGLTLCPRDPNAADDGCGSRRCPADLRSCLVDSDCVVVNAACCTGDVIGNPWYINKKYVSTVDGWRAYECSQGPDKDAFQTNSTCDNHCDQRCHVVNCDKGTCKPLSPDAGFDSGVEADSGPSDTDRFDANSSDAGMYERGPFDE